jgi:hypothetical protein
MPQVCSGIALPDASGALAASGCSPCCRFIPLQAVRRVSSTRVTLAQFDAYTRALQVVRAGSAKLLVPLHAHGAVSIVHPRRAAG